MATTVAPQPGISTAETIEKLTAHLKAEQTKLVGFNERNAAIGAEVASLQGERSDLLCKVAALRSSDQARGKAQTRLDALDAELRKLDREQEGSRLLIAQTEEKLRALGNELEQCHRQQAEETRLVRIRELNETAGAELRAFLEAYERATSYAARLHLAIEKLRELGDDARADAERIKSRLAEASPATLERRGWRFTTGSQREFRILAMLPPASE